VTGRSSGVRGWTAEYTEHKTGPAARRPDPKKATGQDGKSDVLNGGADGDILALLDPALLEGFGAGGRRMLGGTGSDTLRLDDTGVSLDLGAIPDPRIQGIERVDTSGIDTTAV
jgi:hypothetical protein